MEVTNPCYFGTTVLNELETIQLDSPPGRAEMPTVTCSRGEWRPPERLREWLPEGFSVPLECYTGSDGIRRIIPCCSFEELIDLGAVGGLAVLHGFDEEMDHSYRAMLLIHQHVRGRSNLATRGMKEHLTREFKCSADLHIRAKGRLAMSESNVLPDDVFQAMATDGLRPSVRQLTERGRQAAIEAGYRNPTSEQAIQFGFFEDAKSHPLEVADEEVPALVRLSLYDIDGTHQAPSEEIIGFVTERLIEAIHRHLENPNDEFYAWFSGSGNTLVKQIAKQKRKPGGILPREDVRQALLHLGWQAYEYVGQCIHALMRTIKNSIPEPLNEAERQLFERMHESQPGFGDLPAALLAERMPFLKCAVLAIWEAPAEHEPVRVLHRMLQLYAEMAPTRRGADRRFKQRRQDHGTSSGGANSTDTSSERDSGNGLPVQFIDNLYGAPNGGEHVFAQIGGYFREFRGIDCANACGSWEYHSAGDHAESIPIEMRCECGCVETVVNVPIEEFREYGSQFFDYPDNSSSASDSDNS